MALPWHLTTLQWCKEAYKKYPEKITKAVLNTKHYNDTRELAKTIPSNTSANQASIEIINGNTIDVGYDLWTQGFNPLLLNMASEFCPGGGWRKNSTAQEESLFYRSTYCLSLEDTFRIDRHRGWGYPLGPYTAIYSPQVLIMSDQDGYLYNWEDMIWLDFVAMPGIRNPTKINSQYKRLLADKICGVLDVALVNGHDSVVLGALGCGCFNNPPDVVASIFKQVLNDPKTKYRNRFKKIVFAIIDGERTKNGAIFRQELL
jgi:uncharacterized protein (TIGR02452 family)